MDTFHLALTTLASIICSCSLNNKDKWFHEHCKRQVELYVIHYDQSPDLDTVFSTPARARHKKLPAYVTTV